MKHYFGLFIILMLLANQSYSIKVGFHLDRSLVYVTGDKLTLSYLVTLDEDEKLVLEDSDTSQDSNFYSTLFGKDRVDSKNIEVISKPDYSIEEKREDGRIKQEYLFRYGVQFFEVKSVRLSPIKFVYTKNNQRYVTYSPYTTIQLIPPAETNNTNQFQFKDISEPETEKNFILSEDFYYFLAYLLFISTGLGLFSIGLRRWWVAKQNHLANPFKHFNQSISQIKNQLKDYEPNVSELKEIYSQMGLIFKHYLERELKLSLLTKTSDETLSELCQEFEKKGLGYELNGMVKAFFHRCNEVKYSDLNRLSKTEIEMDSNSLQEIVNLIHKNFYNQNSDSAKPDLIYGI